MQYTLCTMDAHIQTKLFEINRTFYDRFADSFSNTRGRVQPGVDRLRRGIARDAAVLDVGCGNGTLARALFAHGFYGKYLGIDLSEGLLSAGRALLGEPALGSFDFRQVDLKDPHWVESLPPMTFDWLVSFAVLHHLPGDTFRQQTVKTFARLIAPESRVAVSVWQWQNSPRLRKRVLPWSTVGLNPDDLDEGDVLLDWRAGKTPGLRYVHTFTEASLTDLAEKAGFEVIETFFSDGSTGDLALYQVWQLM